VTPQVNDLRCCRFQY